MSMQNAAVEAGKSYTILTHACGGTAFGLAMRPGGNLSLRSQSAEDQLHAELAVIDAWEPDEILWIVGHHEEPVPANICAATGASRLTLVPIGTSFGDKPHTAVDAWLASNARGELWSRRILILCQFEIDRAAAAMAQIMGRMGIEQGETERIICESLGCDSIAQDVRSVLEEACRQPFFKSLRSSARRKRRHNPPGVIVAKHLAHTWRESAFRRRSETVQPLSFYLEKTAIFMGWKNWATLSAMLSRPGLPFPAQDAQRRAVHLAFGLDKDKAAEAFEASWENYCARYSPPEDIWTGRAKTFFAAIYAGLYDRHAAFGTTPSAYDLLEAYALDGPIGLLPTAKDYFTGALDGPGRNQFLTFLQMVPGFSLARLLSDEPQRERTLEQIGFLSMQISKYLECPFVENGLPLR